ncbi:MAG: PilN domain-containing protein [Gemmatimonadota bacterium]
MVRVNLLSPADKKTAAARATPSMPRISAPSGLPIPLLGGLLLLMLLAGAVFLYFDQNRQLSALEERIDLAKQDSTRYSRAIAKIRQIETSQSAIVARIEAIQMVDQGRFRWAHILEEISRSLPDYTWLTSVSRREELAEGQIEITGVTYSNLTLTQFMTGLESSPYLENVSLIGSSRSNVDGVDVTSFALVTAYVQPPSS